MTRAVLDTCLGLLLSHLGPITLAVEADRFAKMHFCLGPLSSYSILFKCHIKDLPKILRSTILFPSIPGWYLAAVLVPAISCRKKVLWKSFLSQNAASEPVSHTLPARLPTAHGAHSLAEKLPFCKQCRAQQPLFTLKKKIIF